MSPRLALALQAVYDAGRGTLQHFQSGEGYELKADQSPVTIADKNAEAEIRRAIEAAFPGETILGEEEGLAGASDDRWVIDPIDGTKSFVAGVPLFATLLAYEQAGEPILGVCYFPALDEMVYTERGGGTFWKDRPCRVRQHASLEGAIVCTAGPIGLASASLLSSVASMDEALTVRTWCDAYGHALVATGRADVMIDPRVSRWDISAMAVVVREAGGKFTDLHGQDVLAEEALSTNGAILPAVLEALGR